MITTTIIEINNKNMNVLKAFNNNSVKDTNKDIKEIYNDLINVTIYFSSIPYEEQKFKLPDIPNQYENFDV